jgi:hypothetical protein
MDGWGSRVKDGGCGVQVGSFYRKGQYVTICGKYVNIITTHISHISTKFHLTSHIWAYTDMFRAVGCWLYLW